MSEHAIPPERSLSAPIREALELAGQALHLALSGREITRRNYNVLLNRLNQSSLAMEVLNTLAGEMELLLELRQDRLELVPKPGSSYRWTAEELTRVAGRDGRELFAACLLGTAAFFYPGGVDAQATVLAKDEARLADIEAFITSTFKHLAETRPEEESGVEVRPLVNAWLVREAQAEGKGQTKTRLAVLLRALRLMQDEKLITIEERAGNPLIRPRDRLLLMLRSMTRDERYSALVSLMTEKAPSTESETTD